MTVHLRKIPHQIFWRSAHVIVNFLNNYWVGGMTVAVLLRKIVQKISGGVLVFSFFLPFPLQCIWLLRRSLLSQVKELLASFTMLETNPYGTLSLLFFFVVEIFIRKSLRAATFGSLRILWGMNIFT